MKWRAWYADGSVYASTDTPWRDLPAEGMVGVVRYLSTDTTPYRRIIDGGDWYWLEGGAIHRVMTHEEWGKYAPQPAVHCMECLKKSGVMDDEAWAEVQAEMMAAREAP